MPGLCGGQRSPCRSRTAASNAPTDPGTNLASRSNEQTGAFGWNWGWAANRPKVPIPAQEPLPLATWPLLALEPLPLAAEPLPVALEPVPPAS